MCKKLKKCKKISKSNSNRVESMEVQDFIDAMTNNDWKIYAEAQELAADMESVIEQH